MCMKPVLVSPLFPAGQTEDRHADPGPTLSTCKLYEISVVMIPCILYVAIQAVNQGGGG